MTARPKIPTRREIRAKILDAMAQTLFSDYSGNGAGYLYDCVDEMEPAAFQVYAARVAVEAQSLVDEFARRAARLRK